MPNCMTSKQRVLASMNHEPTDRLPILASDTIQTDQPLDPRLVEFLDAFPFDHRADYGYLIRRPLERVSNEQGLLIDGYGCRFESKGVGDPYCTFSPLADAETVADVEAFDWPDPTAADVLRADAREQVKLCYDQGQYAISVGVGTLFHQYHYLRGFEQWLIDVKLNRAVHEAIAARIAHINLTLLMRLLDKVGEYVDLVTAADDFGTSISTFIDPEDFRELVKPHYQKLIAGIKSRFPHIKFRLHSHGQIMAILPDLIECGVDVLNPVLPLDHMDPVRIKRDFGNDICFDGGIDTEHVLPFGSVEEVRDHVRKTIDILAPGAGYWYSLSGVSSVMPPENVIAALECAAESGG